jgi:hypothetical protein
LPAERFRDYEVIRKLGRGGMGTVYLGRHVHLGSYAALKVLLEHYADDESVKSRFINEARILNDLRHPNIVEQKEFFQEGDHLVMVMEYVEGRSLDQMIGEEYGPIPHEKALPLFLQILEGIAYAHSRGVIHRDIKPSNVLVSKDGQAKITDLGIAKIAGQKGLTRTGTQMGTLYYESPEQIRGAKDVDHRADIYSLGMTLYEMLAGRLPFDADGDTSEFQVMNSIVNRQKQLDPRDYYPHVPEWLVEVVQQATHLAPEKRFQSCESYRETLMEHADSSMRQSEGAYWSGRVSSEASTLPAQRQPEEPQSSAFGAEEEECPSCGARVKDEMEFCGKCGADLLKECPACHERIRWHHEFCPRCGANIGEKLAEIEAERERRRQKEEKRRREAEERRIAEEKRREEAELRRREREEQLRRERAERRRRMLAWWRRHWWKVAAAALVVALGIGISAYLCSDNYAYGQAEALYESGDLEAAASAFSDLGDYRDAEERMRESRFAESSGIITDYVSDLQWRVGPDRNTNWYEARDWVNGLGSGWRMPTLSELGALYDAGITSDDWGPFENSGYWVWTGEERDSSSAWLFFFNGGNGDWLTRDGSSNGRAFAVRSR